tara:strand:- start:214 stop:480 length:267 start_codon:yes stop_codon:yes gene_type:complete
MILSENEIKYVVLTEENKKYIIADQIRQLESMHYQHCLFVPSKLENSTVYAEWNMQKSAIESNIRTLLKRAELEGLSNEALKEILKPA